MAKEKLTLGLIVIVVVMAFGLGALWSKIQTLEKRQTGQSSPPASGTSQPNPAITEEQFRQLVATGNPPILGNQNAKVTMVEFVDFQCPFCKRFADETFSQIKREYIDTGKVKFVFRHLPLRAIHPFAAKAGEAVECSREQGKFWEMHDVIFANQSAIAVADLKQYALRLGLAPAQFDSCLDSQRYQERVSDDEQLASSVGASGTPAFFVNGKLISGALPFESFKGVIDGELGSSIK